MEETKEKDIEVEDPVPPEQRAPQPPKEERLRFVKWITIGIANDGRFLYQIRHCESAFEALGLLEWGIDVIKAAMKK